MMPGSSVAVALSVFEGHRLTETQGFSYTLMTPANRKAT